MRSKGFTLIELIVVIIILGILAATALPRFIDFKTDAARAAVQGIAGGIASGSALNYGAKALSKTVTPASLSAPAATICTATNLGSLIQGGLPANYTVGVSASTATCGSSGYVACAITNSGVSPAVSSTVAVICY